MSAMTIDQAAQEMRALKAQLESAVNDFQKRTGLSVDIYINKMDVSRFSDRQPVYIYAVNVDLSVRTGDA